MSSSGTLPIDSRPRELRLDGFSIVVIEGPNTGATHLARTSEVSVGTAPGNDLVLTDPTVSRHHVSITATHQGFQIKDLGSSNGTWVGAVNLQEGFVDSGVRLRVGRTTFRIDPADEDICEALSPDDRFGSLLGSSSAMRRIFAALPKIARSESTVLLEGETGTGKGVLASAIHGSSARAARPFVVLDCTAIPPSLVESELFGHVRGAFTGASTDRPGAFEQASSGTIFIDEIGELPLEMQPKLLRALAAREVRRIGGSKVLKVDVRVVAATNRRLEREVNSSRFREDLYYRLSVLTVRVPPLRERLDDLRLLIDSFLMALDASEKAHLFTAEVVGEMSRYDWPGNVRELRNYVERKVVLEGEGTLGNGREETSVPSASGQDEPSRVDIELPFKDAKDRVIEGFERAYLTALFTWAEGNVSRAARKANLDRMYLHRLLQRHGLRKSGSLGE
ncbi:MAG: sigma 54-interacting transcriptional regulator [Minicystis sp.]